MQPDDILHFWFEGSGPQKWYNGGDAFDADIRTRFELFCTEAAALIKRTSHHDWEASPEAALALIVALDQFPRNMYRDTKGAFAFDAWALMIARRAVDKGFDLKTSQDRRAFYYMPYMHSEDLAMQDECVRLVDMRLEDENTLFHAKEHRKLIARFGRFPYRNTILERLNGADETAYLDGKGYRP
ncbi:MAG: hypothetical protein COB36_13645 [Alphaproteobacteria bacterium]|nr:MAG: hypothetical protein COB36_13645 [Alphaproteobacteria bacterium]